MLKIEFQSDPRLDSLGRRLRVATRRKTEQLTDMLYNKVVDNVSGKILQKQSGQLANSIRKEMRYDGDHITGSVYPDPASPKAWALEIGGRGYYPIIATKAEVLHFFSKSGEEVFTKAVMHPPSQAFHYMRRALEEMELVVPEGYRAAIEAVLYGGEGE